MERKRKDTVEVQDMRLRRPHILAQKRLVPEGESCFDMVMKWKADKIDDAMFKKD